MDLFDAIKGRRSYRTFSNKPVETEKLDKILEAAHWAPSPANNQPWEFIVISGETARKQLHDFSEKAMRTGTVEIHGFSYVRPLPFGEEAETELASPVAGYSLDFLKRVPVIVAVVGLRDTSIRPTLQERVQDAYKYACAAAIQNMLLAAQAQGLGSLWFTLFDHNVVSEYLHIDRSKHLVALVCLGYPSYEPPSPGRLPLSSKVRHFD